MRLMKVHLRAYRRFLSPTTLVVGGPITVLIGPNEAGKSTLLDAIALFEPGRAGTLGAADVNPGITDEDHYFVELEFYLTPQEQETLWLYHLGWPYQTLPQRVFLRLSAAMSPTLRLDPEMLVNHAVDAKLRTLVAELSLEGHEAPKDPGLVEVLSLLQRFPMTVAAGSVALDLRQRGTGDAANPELIGQLQQALHKAPEETLSLLPRPVEEYHGFLAAYLRNQELRRRPASDLVLEALQLPMILKFGETARDLKAETNLDQVTEHSALANLLIWGGIDIKRFRQWIDMHAEERIITVLTHASRLLTQHLRSVWPFEPVGITLQLKEQSLRLLIEPVGDRSFERPERRSDGLRIFLALLAFLARHRVDSGNAVVLVDELELHLHVDAQWQLVQWLEQQNQFGQIIYSTHSPFALPTDWSVLRAVRPDPALGTSVVDNR
jgi:energy-coupling factor transporter ATP-binding protein EcfA2